MSQHSPSLSDVGMPVFLRDTAIEPRFALGAVRSNGISVNVTSDLASIEAEWRAFEQAADGTVFQTFDWLSTWQRHVGAPRRVRPAVVVGRDGQGGLLFIFALSVERARGVRRLTWLASGLCDYNGPLLARDFAAQVGDGFAALWRNILTLLGAQGYRFDYVDLSKMLETTGSQRNPFFDLNLTPNPNGAYVANLGDVWEPYYTAKRSGPTRKKERKQLKQLGDHGAVAFASVTETIAITTTMEVLIAQKSRAFARLGVSDNFARPGHRDFYLDYTSNPRTRDVVDVSRLDVGDTIAATSLGLRFGDAYYLVLSSYQDGELARFGPGRAHLNELLRHAIEKRFRKFDFTIGDEPYKRDWADGVIRPHDHLEAVTTVGHAAVAAMLGFRRLKRFIKQTPALWAMYSRLREFRGGLALKRHGEAKPGDDE